MTEYLTIPEIADALGCSESYVYGMIHRIPGAWKEGSRWKLTRGDLDRYIQARKEAQCRKSLGDLTPRTGSPGSPTPEQADASASAPTKRTSASRKQSRTPESSTPTIHVPKPRHPSPLRERLRISLNSELQ